MQHDRPRRAQGSPVPPSPVTPDDLIVVIDPHIGFAKFIGTRAMLEAEGVIPSGTDWPQGYDELRWQAGKLDYWLFRKRPPGAKGPRRDFAAVDWFCLRWGPTNQPSFQQLAIERKRRELAEITYRHSAKGRAEWSAQFDRYWKAKNDPRFQAFKTACGIVERKRGRPCKSNTQAQGATA